MSRQEPNTAGFWKKLLSRREPVKPGEVAPTDFAVDLFRHGVYVLVCGGGVIAEPRRAIGQLKRKYGPEGLLRESRILLFESPGDSRFPEGTRSVASGIIYHLADGELLQDLVETRSQWLASPGDLCGKIKRIETLISGIARKLKLACPEGVSSMDAEQEHYAFLMER